MLNYSQLFILIGVLLLSSGIYAQQYNIPPNAQTKTKAITTIDVSEELNNLGQFTPDSPVKAKPMKQLTAAEWEALETSNPDEYIYYQEALEYYNQLSHQVKCALTSDQLWTIYIYDQALKDQLLNY